MNNRKLKKLLKVLLIEASNEVAQPVNHFFQKINCITTQSSDIVSALKYLHQNNYDLILINTELPDMTAKAITKYIRENEKKLKNHRAVIIGISSLIDYSLRQKYISAGMDSVLAGPLNDEKITKILEEYFSEEEPKVPFLNLEDKLIDFTSSAATAKMDLRNAKRMITMLVTEYKKDLPVLKKAKEKNNWEKIRFLAHKYRGGSAYCGTPRLQKASSYLEDYLKNAEETDFRDDLYNQFINEMNKLVEETKHFS